MEFWTGQLDDSQSVFAVGDVRKLTDVGNTQFDIVRVVDFPIGIVDLIDMGLGWIGDIQDGQSLVAGGDVSISSSEVDAMRIVEFDRMHMHRRAQFGHIEYFNPILVANERVSKLHSYGMGMMQHVVADDRCYLGLRRIDQIDHHQTGIAANVSKVTDDAHRGGSA